MGMDKYIFSCMTKSFILAFLLAAWSAQCLAAEKEFKLQISKNDTFVVAETEARNVEVQKMEALRFADVLITPKKGLPFRLMLYFKCDTPDLAQFDTPEKIKNSVLASSKQYLPGSLEKEITLKELKLRNGYGYYTVLTDAKLARLAKVPPGEFKFKTIGMIRVSEDTALGFSLMTNERSKQYKEMFNYIFTFTKGK
jgi:hypothetical protein